MEAKPIPPVDIVTSERAAEAHNAAVEAWGERGWLTVARLCRFFAGHGMEIDCPQAN